MVGIAGTAMNAPVTESTSYEVLKERVGMSVHRVGDTVIKAATNEHNEIALRNEARMLLTLHGLGIAPMLHDYTMGWLDSSRLIQEYIPPGQPIADIEAYRRNCVRLLYILRERGIFHGDLTQYNVHDRDNSPIALDWLQATFTHETLWEPRPRTEDVNALLSLFISRTGDPYRVARRWLAIRDTGVLVPGDTLLDLGCHMGDFCGLAAMDGLVATGVDNNSIRDGLTFARDYWQHGLGMPVSFIESDVFNWVHIKPKDCDTVLMLSMFPYLIRQRGQAVATDFLQQVRAHCRNLFIEIQYHGDGPGPEFLKNDDDCYSYLTSDACGGHPVERVSTIEGRTIWLVH